MEQKTNKKLLNASVSGLVTWMGNQMTKNEVFDPQILDLTATSIYLAVKVATSEDTIILSRKEIEDNVPDVLTKSILTLAEVEDIDPEEWASKHIKGFKEMKEMKEKEERHND